MIVYGLTYLATAFIFLGIDTIWLTVAGGLLYRPLLGPLLRDDFDPVAAVLFYVLYIAGLVVFAIAPTVAASGPRMAALRGGFFGLVAYATYDLTNQATLRGWPVTITVADMIWGTVLSAVAAALGHAVAVRLSRKPAAAPAAR
nr:DUF2177 family protein [uncultured Rhodopila sp.]